MLFGRAASQGAASRSASTLRKRPAKRRQSQGGPNPGHGSNPCHRLKTALPQTARRLPRRPVEGRVKVAHAALVGVLLRLKPHRILSTYAADRLDVMERADHLEKVLAAVTVYAKAIVADTARMAPCGYIHDETGLLKDAASDVVSTLKNCVD